MFEETPSRGEVLGSDQYSASYVLFSNSTGIHLGKRGFATGDYLTPARQLSSTVPEAVRPQSDVLAGPSHTWWAVWSEQVGATEFAQTELFQAKTYIAWTRNGQPFESDDRFDSFEHHAFDADADVATAIDTSSGQVHVVWEEPRAR